MKSSLRMKEVRAQKAKVRTFCFEGRAYSVLGFGCANLQKGWKLHWRTSFNCSGGQCFEGLALNVAHLGVLGKIQVMTALFRIIFWRFLRRLRTCKMPCLGCLGAIQIQRDLERFLGPWSSISLGELSPRIFQITGYSDSPWWSFSICERTYSPLMAGWFRNLDKSGTSNSPVEGTVVEISQEFFVFTVFFFNRISEPSTVPPNGVWGMRKL